jgi:hypothetical protein
MTMSSSLSLVGPVVCLSACVGQPPPSPTDDATDTTATVDGITSVDESTVAGPNQADTTAGTGPTPATDGTTGDPVGCPGSNMGVGAERDACTASSDCASGVCTLYTDVPVNDDAVCAAAPADCSTRVTGTVFDFRTREPIAGANVLVVSALQAAVNPTGAAALVEATSGADGRIDVTSSGPIAEPIGIVALSSTNGYFLTATGVAAPWEDGGSEYNVGTSVHDLWAVPETDLQNWSDGLAMDAEIPSANLPLGERGGVVGLVRDASGQPAAGAVVGSTDNGSGAFIRYLENDGTFSVDRTSGLGIFVILEPALPEEFEVTIDGNVVGGGTAVSADGVIVTLIVNAG